MQGVNADDRNDRNALLLAMDLINKGNSFDSLGDPKEALRCYDEAERILKPQKGKDEIIVGELLLASNRAVAYNNLGDRKTSILQLDHALKLIDHVSANAKHAWNISLDFKNDLLLEKAVTLAGMGNMKRGNADLQGGAFKATE
jgi:tetratricopeptide (TPR) repeat protein